MKTKLMILGAAVVLTPTLALADHHKGGDMHHDKGKKFEEADSNSDGVLSWDEYVAMKEAWIRKGFDKKDADGDGSISKAEMEAAHEKRKEHKKDMMEKIKDNAEHSMEKHKKRHPKEPE